MATEEKIEKIEPAPPKFRALVNAVRNITIPTHIREQYGIESGMEIMLRFEGIINKKESFVPAKELKKE